MAADIHVFHAFAQEIKHFDVYWIHGIRIEGFIHYHGQRLCAFTNFSVNINLER